MYVVYKHTSPNGKIYIGITSQNPEVRWQNGFGYKNNHRFFRDIVKFGWDNFDHSILHSDLAQEDAQSIEAQLIAQYHSDNPQYGYNLISSTVFSQSRPVEQYSTTGEYITVFDSAAQASRQFETKPGVISKAARLKGVSHGYIWKYADDESPIVVPKDINKRIRTIYGQTFRRPSNKLAVCQYTFDGELVAQYPSITDAHKVTGINITCISGCCKGDNTNAKIKRRSAGGFIWKYAE